MVLRSSLRARYGTRNGDVLWDVQERGREWEWERVGVTWGVRRRRECRFLVIGFARFDALGILSLDALLTPCVRPSCHHTYVECPLQTQRRVCEEEDGSGSGGGGGGWGPGKSRNERDSEIDIDIITNSSREPAQTSRERDRSRRGASTRAIVCGRSGRIFEFEDATSRRRRRTARERVSWDRGRPLQIISYTPLALGPLEACA
ncbi:hypothetical protein FIBSPDRAFT_930124 [Athelia psychrophila]|uniref:Uncharacterized protein n=1 Tax=Athelia psychrophila TaxID=1759441 RepID=A0A166MP65_9AGAM|nr:hypothetical protein FIBSPDRAFT_930124 [Fibularhizoctonia sp. CBS 109695]